ncbi:M28 family peptidase [Zunongwangia sp.]|uniref:M28 family peptidase n=1 Tax=Zunongwangia sp. TaxID=1965325 RepID=UPI003AA7FB09
MTAHIQFLASDSLKGRYPGTSENKMVVNYLESEFQKNNITPQLQEFNAVLKRDSSTVKTWNIIGFIEGNDPRLKDEIIVLGAHYDHLGVKDGQIYNDADDNASGTAALLEIAERVSVNRKSLKRSVLFIAFGAEEQGLLGSSYFVNHPSFSLKHIKLMINMDMVGHLNEQQQLYMGGCRNLSRRVSVNAALGKTK